jgi:hypothetical protein
MIRNVSKWQVLSAVTVRTLMIAFAAPVSLTKGSPHVSVGKLGTQMTLIVVLSDFVDV